MKERETEVELKLEKRTGRRYFGLCLSEYIRSHKTRGADGFNAGNVMIRIDHKLFEVIRGGNFMEQANESLKLTAEELENSLHTLEQVANKMNDVLDIVKPRLVRQIEDVRSTRMTIEVECRQLLSALQNVREFFMGKDFHEEMNRVERMVTLCKDLGKLRDDGTLDAISEAILKLAEGAPR